MLRYFRYLLKSVQVSNCLLFPMPLIYCTRNTQLLNLDRTKRMEKNINVTVEINKKVALVLYMKTKNPLHKCF